MAAPPATPQEPDQTSTEELRKSLTKTKEDAEQLGRQDSSPFDDQLDKTIERLA